MAEIVVVGGGIGGMAAALRLRAAGHEVTIVEQRTELGGKLAELRRDGYAFSIGPSLLTWPEVLDELVAVAGERLADLVDLVPLEPVARYRFADGAGFDARTSAEETAAEVDAMAPGEGAAWLRHLAWAKDCWRASLGSFFAGPIDRLSDFAAGTGQPGDAFKVDPLRTLAGRARRSFADPRLRMYAARYATYSGSDPFRAPAALGCTPYLEHAHGAWYVRGGLVRLRDALAGLLRSTGVEIRTGTRVRRIDVTDGRVRAIRVEGGERVAADVVVCDVDAERLYGSLLPTPSMHRRVRRLGRSSSGFLVLAGVRGRTQGLAHHNVLFSSDYRREFADIFRHGRPPTEPTIYLGCSAVTEPSQAPADHENWVLLVNVPSSDPATWPVTAEDYRDQVLDRLAHYGLDVSGRLEFSDMVTPRDFAMRYDAWDGALYSTPHHGRLAPIRRPGNRGPVRGLYLVGGATHPGGGLPLVVKSAEIVAGLIRRECP